MASYADLQTSVSGLLNRRDATTAQIQGVIQNGIQRIQRELRVPAMEKTVLATIDASFGTNGGLIIPTDFLQLINLIPQGAGEIRRLKKVDITRALTLQYTMGGTSPVTGFNTIDVGIPQVYARQGGVWVIGPVPVNGDVIRIDYYAELTPLVNPTDTNVISMTSPDLIWYAALSYVGDFFSDKRIPMWEGRYVQIRDDLNVMAETDEENGESCVTAAYDYPDSLQELY